MQFNHLFFLLFSLFKRCDSNTYGLHYALNVLRMSKQRKLATISDDDVLDNRDIL